MSRKKQDGQSAVEFVLLAPFLFLFFFLTLQIFYTAFTALAVQRAALAIARESSITGIGADDVLREKLILALAPLSSLHPATFAGILGANYERSLSPNGQDVVVKVHFPMPIWVPMVGKVLGERLPVSLLLDSYSERKSLQDIFHLLGHSIPDLSFSKDRLPYFRWVIFEAVTHNEGYSRNLAHE